MTTEELYKIIDDFLLPHADRPAQGTIAWVEGRLRTIGGSEVAKLLGIDYQKKPIEELHDDLRSSKLGLSKFSGNVFTMFGNLLESHLCRFTELRYRTRIVGTEASILNTPHQSYSPDGLGVVKTNGKNEIVLFEFKCPWSRVPVKNQPPPYYIPQVQLGLGTFPFASYGVLIEAVIKRCTWDQLDFTQNYSPVVKELPKFPENKTHACGFIGFVRSDEAGPQICPQMTDYGGVCRADYEVLLNNHKRLQIIYSEVICEGDAKAALADELEAFKMTPGALCYLPWKLIHLVETRIDRDPAFMDTVTPMINEFMTSVNEQRNAPKQPIPEVDPFEYQ